uniref:Probable cytosolic iron-sulfur protein assembly protein CIAO1 homolog n=1 Tax=Schistocephalus solidus TaxID=70667 RepID=A0A0V0J7M3_SCHSO
MCSENSDGDCMQSAQKLQSLAHHEERIWCVQWNHTGSILASCGEDKSLCLWIWEDTSWKLSTSSTDNHTKTIRTLAWSPCDRYIATASFDASVVIMRVTKSESEIDLQSIAILEGHANEVKCVAWAISGHLLATCGRDKSVWVWEFDDEEDCQCVSVLQPHSADVKSVFWHPIKEILGSTSYDNTINLYKEELDDWVVACKLVGHDSTVWKAQFSPSGLHLASASEDKTLRIWMEMPDSKSFHWVCCMTISDAHSAPVFDLAWSPCGCYLASCGGDDSICIFRSDLPSSTCSPDVICSPSLTLWLHLRKAHSGDVNSVCWYPTLQNPIDNSKVLSYLLASGGDDRLVNIWSIPLDPDCTGTLCVPPASPLDDELD